MLHRRSICSTSNINRPPAPSLHVDIFPNYHDPSTLTGLLLYRLFSLDLASPNLPSNLTIKYPAPTSSTPWRHRLGMSPCSPSATATTIAMPALLSLHQAKSHRPRNHRPLHNRPLVSEYPPIAKLSMIDISTAAAMQSLAGLASLTSLQRWLHMPSGG